MANPGTALLSTVYRVLSLWTIATLFLLAWWQPLLVADGGFVKYGMGLIIIEFVVVHSSGFCLHLALRDDVRSRSRQRLKWAAGLGTIYLILGGGYAIVLSSFELLLGFLLVTGPRLRDVWEGLTLGENAAAQNGPGFSALMYLILIGLVSFAPIPALGLPPDVARAFVQFDSDNILVREPHRIMAMGSVYFFVMGIFEAAPEAVVRMLWYERGKR